MEAVRAVALACILVAAAVPTGAAGLRLCGLERKDFYNGAERWLIAAGFGLGLFAFLLTLAGLGQVLYPPVVLLLPVVVAGVTAPVGLKLLVGWGDLP
ncbi:MAG: hypothetical protein ACRDI2_23820, partial [Chloroflexota bacterium]